MKPGKPLVRLLFVPGVEGKLLMAKSLLPWGSPL